MAVFGEIVAIFIGLIMIVGSAMLFPFVAGLGNRGESWFIVVLGGVGVAVIWVAIIFGPLTLGVQ